MDVSIIYVNYNSSNLIINSINSVIELTNGVSYEIIIVDNNSRTEEKNKLSKENNYARYVKKISENKKPSPKFEKCKNQEDFCKFIKKYLEKITLQSFLISHLKNFLF